MTDQEKSKEVTVSTPQALVKLNMLLKTENIERKTIVSAKVICWDCKKNGLLVFFGNQIKGFIPNKHISIYPSYDRTGVPSEATYIIGKNIVAEVIDYNSDKTEFILSRANAMRKRIQEIQINEKVEGNVVGVNLKALYVDVGSGVMGRVICSEITESFIEDMAYMGYHDGSRITLKVINIVDNKLELSRTKIYPKYDMSMFNIGDPVEARVVSELTRPLATISCSYAYCLEVADNPNIKGVIDSNIQLNKGAIIKAKIHKITEKGLRLRLISI